MFVAIGHRPNTDLFTGMLDMDENGYLVTRPGTTYTNVDRRVRLRRRAGPHLPPGDHGRRFRLHGGDRLPSAGSSPRATADQSHQGECDRRPLVTAAAGAEWSGTWSGSTP